MLRKTLQCLSLFPWASVDNICSVWCLPQVHCLGKRKTICVPLVWMEFGQLEDMGINAIGIPISHLWVFGCFISCLRQHIHALGQTSLILLDFHQRGLAMRKWNLFPFALCPLFQSQNIIASQTPLHYPSPASHVNISKLTEQVSVLKKTSFEACTCPAQKLRQDQDPSAPNTEQGHCKSAQSLSQISGKPAAAARTSPLCRFATFLCFCCALYRKAGDREISVAFTIWQGYNKSLHLGAKMLHLLIERQLPQIKAAAFYAHTSIHVMCLINISALLFSSFASTQLLVPTIRTGFTGQQLAGESSILLKGTQRDWPLGVI